MTDGSFCKTPPVTMAAASKSKQDIVAEFRRGEILDAARTVFTSKGFRNATIEQIAEAAGLAKGTVYLYFPSKQDVFTATLDREMNGYMQHFASLCHDGMSFREVLRALALSLMGKMQVNKEFLLVCISDFGRYASTSSLPEPLQRFNRHLAKVLRESLNREMEEGLIRSTAPPDRTIAAAILLIKQWAIRRTVEGSRVAAEDDAEFLADVIWKGVRE